MRLFLVSLLALACVCCHGPAVQPQGFLLGVCSDNPDGTLAREACQSVGVSTNGSYTTTVLHDNEINKHPETDTTMCPQSRYWCGGDTIKLPGADQDSSYPGMTQESKPTPYSSIGGNYPDRPDSPCTANSEPSLACPDSRWAPPLTSNWCRIPESDDSICYDGGGNTHHRVTNLLGFGGGGGPTDVQKQIEDCRGEGNCLAAIATIVIDQNRRIDILEQEMGKVVTILDAQSTINDGTKVLLNSMRDDIRALRNANGGAITIVPNPPHQ